MKLPRNAVHKKLKKFWQNYLFEMPVMWAFEQHFFSFKTLSTDLFTIITMFTKAQIFETITNIYADLSVRFILTLFQ